MKQINRCHGGGAEHSSCDWHSVTGTLFGQMSRCLSRVSIEVIKKSDVQYVRLPLREALYSKNVAKPTVKLRLRRALYGRDVTKLNYRQTSIEKRCTVEMSQSLITNLLLATIPSCNPGNFDRRAKQNHNV